MKPRDYQQEIFNSLISSNTHDIVQLDTGAGKTIIEAMLALHYSHVMLVAHRNILITQISEKLAAFKIPHDTISTEHTRRSCQLSHIRKHGVDYIERGNKTKLVASIDSLLAMKRRCDIALDTNTPWVIVIDEAHHALEKNKWGKVKEILPNARIIGFTATPARHDGNSLGIKDGGLFERLVQSEELKVDSVKTLIKRGTLSGFKCYAAVNKIKVESLKIIGGDYTQDSLLAAFDKQIFGDAVEHYKKIMKGKQVVVMCISINNAEECAESFRSDGIPSSFIASSLTDTEIGNRMDAFASGEIKVLCNVNMIGEGFDMPGIDGMILLRKTDSFILYRQWIGRSLRTNAGKEHAIILDCAGNIAHHGFPDEHVKWSINDRFSKSASQYLPCPKCRAIYNMKLLMCPECSDDNPLLSRCTVGGHYVNQERIDARIVEVHRRELDKKLLEKEDSQRMGKEVVIPEIHWRTDVISQLCKKLICWFVESIKKDIPPRELNEFLRKREILHDHKFWTDHFTIRDLQETNTKKALGAYRKWQSR